MSEFALLSILHFSDGGESEFMVLHRGAEEDCKRLAELLPAVSYSGPRPVARAELQWGPMASQGSTAAEAEKQNPPESLGIGREL